MFGNMIGKGYSQKRHDGNEHGFWRLLCHEKRLKLNQGYGAKTPIIDAVYEILYEGKDARAVLRNWRINWIKHDFLFF
jgi:glycerol-3-phosphate dehydrogenase (NAD(P)+)